MATGYSGNGNDAAGAFGVTDAGGMANRGDTAVNLLQEVLMGVVLFVAWAGNVDADDTGPSRRGEQENG